MKPTPPGPTPPRPWYFHRWPWILMAGPAAVVAAGIVTAVLAVATADPVVADYNVRTSGATAAKAAAP